MALLGFACLVVAGGVAYVYYREGLLASFAASISALLSSMVAFQVWPYIANELEPAFRDTFLDRCEDALALSVVFAASFALLRLATVQIVKHELDYSNAINRAGGVVFGALTGYFVGGFIMCVAQTLPLQQKFLGFQPPPDDNFVNRILPSDQNLLKVMEKARTGTFKGGEEPAGITFQNFAHIFARDRRYPDPDSSPPQPTAPAPELPPRPKPKFSPIPVAKKAEEEPKDE